MQLVARVMPMAHALKGRQPPGALSEMRARSPSLSHRDHFARGNRIHDSAVQDMPPALSTT